MKKIVHSIMHLVKQFQENYLLVKHLVEKIDIMVTVHQQILLDKVM